MEPVRRIRDFETFKLLGDSRRLEILRLLMCGPESLSSLGRQLGEYPARVRHHLKLLEQARLVELTGEKVVRGFVEKYYQASAQAFTFNGLILPAPDNENGFLVALGSDDLALELLAEIYNRAMAGKSKLLVLPVGSLDGLIALRQGIAHLAGCHLYDPGSGEYNLPFIRYFFPDRPVVIITLAQREQGLLLPPGNPLHVTGIEDLVFPGILYMNRIRGSGTRLWLDRELEKHNIPVDRIAGYAQERRTHTEVAAAISQGKANAGLGLLASARQFQLEFIPLFKERYDLVIPADRAGAPEIEALISCMRSEEFKSSVEGLGGYDTAQTGANPTIEKENHKS
ncbi:MAG: substrate-binding domain-containing protein [Omnitrophica WOR_2 bacterium]